MVVKFHCHVSLQGGVNHTCLCRSGLFHFFFVWKMPDIPGLEALWNCLVLKPLKVEAHWGPGNPWYPAGVARTAYINLGVFCIPNRWEQPGWTQPWPAGCLTWRSRSTYPPKKQGLYFSNQNKGLHLGSRSTYIYIHIYLYIYIYTERERECFKLLLFCWKSRKRPF